VKARGIRFFMAWLTDYGAPTHDCHVSKTYDPVLTGAMLQCPLTLNTLHHVWIELPAAESETSEDGTPKVRVAWFS